MAMPRRISLLFLPSFQPLSDEEPVVYANLSVEMEGLSSEQILLCESKEVEKTKCKSLRCCLFFLGIFFPLLGQVGSPYRTLLGCDMCAANGTLDAV